MLKGSRETESRGMSRSSSKKRVGEQAGLEEIGEREKRQKQVATDPASAASQQDPATRLAAGNSSTPENSDLGSNSSIPFDNKRDSKNPKKFGKKEIQEIYP